MDPNSKLSVILNAIRSLVLSLLTLFGVLKLDHRSTINRLPSEMMQLVLDKLNLDDDDGDLKKLLRLRLVSSKWKLIVEDYCARKKSLIVVLDRNIAHNDIYFRWFGKRFFGLVKLQEFEELILDAEMTSQCLGSLLKVFPNVVRLSVRCNEPARIPDLVAYINSLASLKQLDLVGRFVPALSTLSPTLRKLEHFSFDIPWISLSDDSHHHLVSNLGPNCVGLYFPESVRLDADAQVRLWHSINPNWLGNVTHLQFDIESQSEEHHQVVAYLSEHAQKLKVLNIIFSYLPFGLAFTTSLIDDLSKLTHLVELELDDIEIAFSVLERAARQGQLTSLPSVKTVTLFAIYIENRSISADQITRLLAAIYPNLIQFNLIIKDRSPGQELPPPEEIGQHLGPFVNVPKHFIMVT